MKICKHRFIGRDGECVLCGYLPEPISELDTGARCDRHVGEVFPPRCYDCDAAARQEQGR